MPMLTLHCITNLRHANQWSLLGISVSTRNGFGDGFQAAARKPEAETEKNGYRSLIAQT